VLSTDGELNSPEFYHLYPDFATNTRRHQSLTNLHIDFVKLGGLTLCGGPFPANVRTQPDAKTRQMWLNLKAVEPRRTVRLKFVALLCPHASDSG
jgi:hypothetical protein